MNYNKEDMSWVKLTTEFKSILKKIDNTNDNFFITGKAGTGKSTLLQYYYNTTNKKCVLLAPTGRAAINIKGQTLHSFFHLDWGVLDPSDYINKSVNQAKNIDTIIIDEISMVRSDILDSIDKILKKTMKNNLPFGGKQMILFGDPFQLSPIVPKNTEIEQFFTHSYKSEYFFDSNSFSLSSMKIVELKYVFRQKNEDFIKILNRIRIGEHTASDLDIINNRIIKNKSNDDNRMILTPFKRRASEINNAGLNSLPKPECKFYAIVKGKINQNNIPANRILTLKKGSKVMFVKNGISYVNGSLGVVTDIKNNEVTVKKEGRTIVVKYEEWEDFKYKYNNKTGELEKIIVGSFKQIPLILAWAITIHKCQGSTLEGVHIDLDRGCFAYGQTYVALSRTQSLMDMTLEKPLLDRDIKIDKRVYDYYQSIK